MSSTVERVGTHFLLIVFAIIAVYPLISIVILALTPPNETVTGFSLPSEFTLDNFAIAWRPRETEPPSSHLPVRSRVRAANMSTGHEVVPHRDVHFCGGDLRGVLGGRKEPGGTTTRLRRRLPQLRRNHGHVAAGSDLRRDRRGLQPGDPGRAVGRASSSPASSGVHLERSESGVPSDVYQIM